MWNFYWSWKRNEAKQNRDGEEKLKKKNSHIQQKISNCDVKLRFINFPHIKALNQKLMNINYKYAHFETL